MIRNAAFTLALVFITSLVFAQERQQFTIALIDDAPTTRLSYQRDMIVGELLTLVEREFDVELKRYTADWSSTSIRAAAARAYADPDVDLVLVTGFIANQVIATRGTFPKPTFLPLIVDEGLLPSPSVNGQSGIDNLNYLRTYANFGADLDTFRRMVDFDTIALLVDAELSSSIPELREAAYQASRERGVTLLEIPHDGSEHDLASQIPPDTDAVFVAGLPRMPEDAFATLADRLAEMQLPSYSFAGVNDVQRGLLMTNSEPRDNSRLARLNALNMQAVMLGEPAARQTVDSQIKDRLTVNMDTARRIGLSPSFDILADAVILNGDAREDGDALGLVDIAQIAMLENQDLLAESYGVAAGNEDIRLARSRLLPQLEARATIVQRKDTPIVASGIFPERRNDAALSLSQLVYSDPAAAAVRINRLAQRSREEALRQLRLDIILAATTSYYQVLNARSQLRVQEDNLIITRENLELAEDRVRLGTSTAADVYRWQAEVAQARIRVVNARAAMDQAWETLNRLLHRPPGSRLALRDATFNEPFVMTRDDFDRLIRNQTDYSIFSGFYIRRAVEQAPEIASLDAQIEAKRRELKSNRRSFWLPEFSVAAELTENISQRGAGFATGQGLQDWNVALRATLPLFAGGQRRAELSQSELELKRLVALRIATEERVEEAIRIQLHAAQAKYVSIELASTAADATRKNFELISDAYARGTVSVIELLDAQEASLNASAAATESLYDFLITVMALQRAVGGYDYLLPADQRAGLAQQFEDALQRSRQ